MIITYDIFGPYTNTYEFTGEVGYFATEYRPHGFYQNYDYEGTSYLTQDKNSHTRSSGYSITYTTVSYDDNNPEYQTFMSSYIDEADGQVVTYVGGGQVPNESGSVVTGGSFSTSWEDPAFTYNQIKGYTTKTVDFPLTIRASSTRTGTSQIYTTNDNNLITSTATYKSYYNIVVNSGYKLSTEVIFESKSEITYDVGGEKVFVAPIALAVEYMSLDSPNNKICVNPKNTKFDPISICSTVSTGKTIYNYTQKTTILTDDYGTPYGTTFLDSPFVNGIEGNLIGAGVTFSYKEYPYQDIIHNPYAFAPADFDKISNSTTGITTFPEGYSINGLENSYYYNFGGKQAQGFAGLYLHKFIDPTGTFVIMGGFQVNTSATYSRIGVSLSFTSIWENQSSFTSSTQTATIADVNSMRVRDVVAHPSEIVCGGAHYPVPDYTFAVNNGAMLVTEVSNGRSRSYSSSAVSRTYMIVNSSQGYTVTTSNYEDNSTYSISGKDLNIISFVSFTDIIAGPAFREIDTHYPEEVADAKFFA